MTKLFDFDENRKKLSENVKNSLNRPKKDMREYEKELHNEIRANIWFLEKAGWDREEIDYATLMRIPRERIEKYLERTQ
jgi:hypothetical protein